MQPGTNTRYGTARCRPQASSATSSVQSVLDQSDGNEPRPTGRRPPLHALCGQMRISETESTRMVPEQGGGGGQENRPGVQGRSNRSRGPQRRYWCFTSNTAADPKLVQAIEGGLGAFGGAVRYIVFQKERASTGQAHFQGYVETYETYRLIGIRRVVSGHAHFEPRRGTQGEAIAYCKKEETRIEGPWEFGTPSSGQGTRTDLITFRDAIKTGKRARDLYEEQPLMMAKYPKFYERYRMCLEKEKWRKMEVILLIGDTGTGKTRWVYDHWESFWRLPMVTTGLWFDTYDGQTHALLDDFAGAASKVSLSSLLQILDGYWVKVPIKGGFTWWGVTYIAITTNIEPALWYKWRNRENQYMALARRFTKIMQFLPDYETCEYTSGEYFHAEDIIQ